MSSVTEQRLREIVDFSGDQALIRGALSAALDAADGEQLVRFFARYISWNGFFGAGDDSRTGVADGHHGTLAIPPPAMNRNGGCARASVDHGVDGVVQEIEHDLLQLYPVTKDDDRIGLEVERHRHLLDERIAAQEVSNIANDQ